MSIDCLQWKYYTMFILVGIPHRVCSYQTNKKKKKTNPFITKHNINVT